MSDNQLERRKVGVSTGSDCLGPMMRLGHAVDEGGYYGQTIYGSRTGAE